MVAPPPPPPALPPLRVGALVLDPPVVLAPMEGVTDLPFRRLVRDLGGVGLTCTEFVPGAALSRGDRLALRTALFDPDEHPVSIQVYGRDPEVLAEAARRVADLGADICDINMGCPSKRVCARSGGSALMRDPDLAVAIVRAVRRAVRIPVTVKMRAGFDAAHRNAPELAWRCQEEGADMVTVHWRTREDRYGGTWDPTPIAETVARLSIPVLGNGDVVDLPSAARMLERTGCAGLMIGRGAIRDPWTPARVTAWLRGHPLPRVDAARREEVLVRMLAAWQRAIPSPRGALGRFKMFAGAFLRALPQGETARAWVVRSRTADEATTLVRAYFACLRRWEAGDEAAFAGTRWEAPPPPRGALAA